MARQQLRPIVPSATWCRLGERYSSRLSTAVSSAPMAPPMLPVRSATIAKSIGVATAPPHEPLHAAETSRPVEPLSIPTAGPKPNRTGLSSATWTVLHVCAGVAGQGIAQMLALQRVSAAIVPGSQVPGIWAEFTEYPDAAVASGTEATTQNRATSGALSGSFAWAKAVASASATSTSGSATAPAWAAASTVSLSDWRWLTCEAMSTPRAATPKSTRVSTATRSATVPCSWRVRRDRRLTRSSSGWTWRG